MDPLWILLFILSAIGLIASWLLDHKTRRDTIARLRDDGFKHVFYGKAWFKYNASDEGMNYIAFNIEHGCFRFGKFGSRFVERPVNYLSHYEWKWLKRGAQKVSNKFLFQISDVDHFMHEVFYFDNERQAEIEWARLQAVYHESLSYQYEMVGNMQRENSYDFFISHASEDKNEFVRPLANALRKLGLKIWYDEFTLEVGDSLRRAIDQGLRNSKYGIVVLSPTFFSKEWPQYELDALVNKSMFGEKVILPVWYGVQLQDVSQYSHGLADRVAFSSATQSIDEMANGFLRLVQKNG